MRLRWSCLWGRGWGRLELRVVDWAAWGLMEAGGPGNLGPVVRAWCVLRVASGQHDPWARGWGQAAGRRRGLGPCGERGIGRGVRHWPGGGGAR